VVERAEVDPVGFELCDALEFGFGQIDEIVSHGPYDTERRLALHVEFDFGRAGGPVFQDLHELGRHAARLQHVERLLPAGVGSNAAQGKDLMA
jgi:hypothetical protein